MLTHLYRRGCTESMQIVNCMQMLEPSHLFEHTLLTIESSNEINIWTTYDWHA
jgi:hypothetical protein